MVCDAKPSHHRSQMLASQFHGVCLCTTGEDEVEGTEKREGGGKMGVGAGCWRGELVDVTG